MVTDNFIEQADIIRRHSAGWVVPQDPAEAARVIMSLTPDQIRTVAARAKACAVDYHWDIDRKVLVDAYRKLLER
jgi:hypothetical protein